MRTGTVHREHHRANRVGWLRAAVLGANDGLLSTASLIVGVAAAKGTQRAVLLAGVAGLVAGAMSMAAGEYVSVYSQADAESADLAREQAELIADPAGEQAELASIYIDRGLAPDLANEVAGQLMAHNALEAHVRDELGITEALSARPLQAASASAASFAIGAAVPLLVCYFASPADMVRAVGAGSLLCLALLGALAAKTGGASVVKGAVRVVLWGALAMAFTLAVGALFKTSA